jgi:hypothetical protein
MSKTSLTIAVLTLGCGRTAFDLFVEPASECAPPPAVSAVKDTAPGTWRSLPDTTFESVCACHDGFPETCTNQTQCWGVISLNGAAYSACRDQLFLMGAKHDGYYGNEVYLFDVASARWRRLTDPSPPPAAECGDSNTDGTPTARSVYDGLVFIEHADRLLLIGGRLACAQPTEGSNRTWLFDPNTGTWRDMRPSGDLPTAPSSTLSLKYVADYDPQTGLVFLQTVYGFFAYSYDDNRWTKLATLDDDGMTSVGRSGIVIAPRRLFLTVGSARVDAFPLDGGPAAPEFWNTTGDQRIVLTGGAPGLAYDPVSDSVLAWSVPEDEIEPTPVFRLDLDTRVWSEVATPYLGGVAIAERGAFGRWARLAHEPAILVVVDHLSDVQLLRLP